MSYSRLLLLAALFVPSFVRADAKVDFARDVFPLLQKACFECHGADKQRGKLRLDSREAILRGGSSGPAMVAGKADASELVRRVNLAKGSDGVMPDRGDTLTKSQIDVLRTWIDQGAVWPSTVNVRPHWAYVKPTRPTPPTVANPAWIKTPVDAFVLARLEKEGWKPSPAAERATLLRRVTLDLIGLPPTLDETAAFLADESPTAYEKAVERLLTSPHFGERWARHWLDLARYADSHGFQKDDFRNTWPYRDWVIRAFNRDLPYDRFTIEQIAGDLLPEPTLDQKIATGFHRLAPTNVEAGTEPEETRVNQIFDRVNTTATIWLGATLECAQCHNHKYDPFSQKEYYQLFAFFNQTALEAARSNPKVPGSIQFLGPYLTIPANNKKASVATTPADSLNVEAKLEERKKQLLADLPNWEKRTLALLADADNDDDMIPAAIAKLVKIPADQRTEKQSAKLVDHVLEQDAEYQRLLDHRESSRGTGKGNATTLVMQDAGKPRVSTMFQRGDFKTPGENVKPATPAVLHPLKESAATRLALARWLVDRDNPLAARVAVNRFWAEIFGHGIVGSPEDFGIKGETPTHPELLDWLAVEFMDKGWSVKQLLRTIVCSATYRQSSKLTPLLREKDDQNRLYARGPRVRMDAEMIRDNALSAAGLLSKKQFGPPIRPYQPDGLWQRIGGVRVDYVVSPPEERHRRGIYVVHKRSVPYPSFVNFDATNRYACTVKRSRSNTPLQALTLLNDPVYVEAAMALAKRVVLEQAKASLDDRLRYAVRTALCREATPAEVRALQHLYDEQVAVSRAQAKEAERLFAKTTIPAGVSPEEFVGWYAVATALFNLDEMITKN